MSKVVGTLGYDDLLVSPHRVAAKVVGLVLVECKCLKPEGQGQIR